MARRWGVGRRPACRKISMCCVLSISILNACYMTSFLGVISAFGLGSRPKLGLNQRHAHCADRARALRVAGNRHRVAGEERHAEVDAAVGAVDQEADALD